MQFDGHAFILTVIESLLKHGSVAGKTHIQKALSLLSDSKCVQVPFSFVLYKHGPYSFDVEEALEQMQSYGAISVEPSMSGYGVALRPSNMASFVRTTAPLSEQQRNAIEKVCVFVGPRNVKDLERLATALWIRSHLGIQDRERVAKQLHSLKPHIPISTAEQADEEVTGWLNSIGARLETSPAAE